MKTVILCTLLTAILLPTSMVDAEDNVLKISAFNIQIFGLTKASKPEVMTTIVKIIRKYDIILIQEIRDSSNTAIYQLLDKVNGHGAPLYEMELSERLGRTSSKEQYAFFYRNNANISVEQTYQYPDINPEDVFEREPFAVKFSIGDITVKEIVLVGIHIKHSEAVEEMNALDGVHDIILEEMGTENILILGDLNVDCSYVTQTEMDNLLLRNDPKYNWLIGDEIDTTVKTTTNCAYDRFVLIGKYFFDRVVPGSARVFRFDTEYELTQSQAEDVSDHYPIEMNVNILTKEDLIANYIASTTQALQELLTQLGDSCN